MLAEGLYWIMQSCALSVRTFRKFEYVRSLIVSALLDIATLLKPSGWQLGNLAPGTCYRAAEVRRCRGKIAAPSARSSMTNSHYVSIRNHLSFVVRSQCKDF